jgi:hypothetical protein
MAEENRFRLWVIKTHDGINISSFSHTQADAIYGWIATVDHEYDQRDPNTVSKCWAKWLGLGATCVQVEVRELPEAHA